MTEAVTETVVGVLDGITEKPSGWTEITVKVEGWQYPVKMATKLQPLIELARAAGTEEMSWRFKKQESDSINPNSGKPYVNRYFEGVEPYTSENAPNATVADADGMTPEKWDAKERRDLRSRAWAQTIALAAHTIEHGHLKDAVEIKETFIRLQIMQRKIYEDVAQSFAYPADQEDVPF